MAKTRLEKAGLGRKEALVYEAILKWGELTPSQIFKETSVTRENIYNIAEELEQKELIERIPGRKLVTFRPLSPLKFKSYLKKKKEAINEEEIALDSIFPELLNYYKLSSKKSEVTYFKGLEGIKYIYEGLFYGTPPKEILVFRTPKDNELGEYLLNHLKLMSEKGIHSRVLAPKFEILPGKVGNFVLDQEIRYIDDKDFIFPSEISISDNQVVFCSYDKEKMGAIIANKDLAETFTKLFNLLWKNADRKPKK
jgi:sugar-specific transcriptional regulator TrmB